MSLEDSDGRFIETQLHVCWEQCGVGRLSIGSIPALSLLVVYRKPDGWMNYMIANEVKQNGSFHTIFWLMQSASHGRTKE